jgi:hypothetical protein
MIVDEPTPDEPRGLPAPEPMPEERRTRAKPEMGHQSFDCSVTPTGLAPSSM